MSWDIALSEAETGDYSACVVLLRRAEVFYILEVVRGRFPFDTLKQKVMEVKRRYAAPTLLIEDSPISRGLIQSLREKSINVTTCPFRKCHPAWIRFIRQNHRIIRIDVCDLVRARNVRRRPVQVAVAT